MSETATRRRIAREERVELPRQFRQFTVDRTSVNEDARTVELAFSSEFPVERWYGNEILDHAPSSVRLGRLNGGGALLMNHDSRDQVGVVEQAAIGADRKGRARVRFGESQRASEIFRDVVTGIRQLVSVGYAVHAMQLESSDDSGDTYRVTDWEPVEISMVAVPADPSVGVGRAAEEKTNVRITHPLQKERAMPPEQTVAAPATPAPAVPNVQEIANQAREAETARVREISAAGEQFNQRDLAQQYIAEGRTVAEFQRELLSRIRAAAEQRGRTSTEVGLTDQEVREFSFVRMLRALANPSDGAAQRAAAYEREVSEAAQKRAGKSSQGFMLPVDILRAPMLGLSRAGDAQAVVQQLLARMMGQRDLTVGSATAGGNLVATNLLAGSFIDMLRNRMVLQRLGVFVLNDLTGNIAIPRQTGGGTAYWVAESGSPTESTQAVDQVTMSPKTVGAFTDYSRKLLLQSSIDVEAFVRMDLAKVIGLEIDRAGLYGSGSANQPLGLKDQTGVNTVDLAAAAPTFAEIVSMETAVAADNADVGTLAYAVNATGRGGLKTTEKASSTGQFIWEPGNTINGYRAEVSNQIASGDFWYGNWADLVMGFWSGLDVTVDPYTASTSGSVRIVALQDVDVACRHGESFCRANNTL